MKLIFIASPFRASTPWQVAENVRAAERLALEVWRMGAVAVCPQSMSALFDKEGPDERYLAGWLAVLARCDAVLVGATSSGVLEEIHAARRASIPVHESIDALREWIEAEEAPLFAR